MIFVKDLFNTQNVLCPEWLSDIPLEDEWLDSEYCFENGVHKWHYKDVLKDVEIIYDGSTYKSGAYIDGLFHLLHEETEEYCLEV